GKTKINLSTSANMEEIAFLPEFQTSYGSGSHYATSFGNSGYKTNYLDRMHDNWRPFENQQYGDPFNGEDRIIGRVTEDGSKLILPYSNVKDGRKNSFDKGRTLNNQVSFQGGDEKST